MTLDDFSTIETNKHRNNITQCDKISQPNFRLSNF